MKEKLTEIRVAVGATSLIKPLTGIGNYTVNLCSALQDIENVELEFFYGSAWSSELKVLEQPGITRFKRIVRGFLPHAYKFRRIIQQRFFKFNDSQAFDVYHEPNFIPLNFDGPTVITVHDMSYLRFPEAHPKERVKMMNELLGPAIKKADCVIADSYYTKEEILSEFDVSSDKVHVTHLGKSEIFYPRLLNDIKPVVTKYGLVAGKYTIAVGTIEPRKNLIQAIRAYQTMPDDIAKSYPLAVVGVRGWGEGSVVSELSSLVKQGKAVMLGYVDSEDLPFLYSGARSLIFPSLYEGFGLPVLEAMACGTPVIASNSSCIPEVVGNAGKLIEVGDVLGMQSSILEMCLDDDVYNHCSKLGLEQAEKFSWKKCAEQTLKAYQYAIKSSSL